MRACLASLVCCALLPTLAPAADLITETPTEVRLTNARLTLVLSKDGYGALYSLVDTQTGLECIAPQGRPALFALAFSAKGQPTAPLTRVEASQAATLRTRVERRGEAATAVLEYGDVGQPGVNVVCTATVSPADPLVRWRLSLTFPDTLVLEEVQYPQYSLRAPLGERVEDDALVIGATKGGVVRAPASLKTGTRVSAAQPGTLAAQFGCLVAPRAGFYMAAYDATGYPKRLVVARTAEGLAASWTQCCFAASPFALDYDLVLTTFTGADVPTATDWRDGADLYRAWAERQPWCARPLTRRTDLPQWLRAAPAMVRFNRDWLTDPSLIKRWLTEYWGKRFPATPLITAYWGWEKVATWVTPDYFPVYPSDGAFAELEAWTRKRDCHAFFWPSGYHWTLTYGKQADDSFTWDDRARFEAVGAPHAVVTRDGKTYRAARSWLRGGETSCLCPGDSWTIDWWNREVAAPCARRGVEIVQSDQVVGGSFPWCYSTTHGHPPGPGAWMAEAFARQLATEREQCRKHQRDFVVCCEEPNEHLNHLVGVQDYRDCESRYEWASVYNYLYHDFVPTFQSNPHANDTVMTAYCFANGQMPHLSPSMALGPGPLLVNGEFEGVPGRDLPGWSQVKEYQGKQWRGTWARDEAEKHGGQSSLRLDNATEDDIVQVSQNVPVGGEFAVGRTYRLSAWMKTDHAREGGAIAAATLTGSMTSTGGCHLPYPAAGAGWQRVSGELTIKPDSLLLRIMIHVVGTARVWVDDMTLEEVLPDGQTAPVMRPELPLDHDLMRRWVELYHGVGRPYLFYGRMLHPPKLTAGTVERQGRTFPAIMHNAYRAPDGSEACILVNATRSLQSGELTWHGRTVKVELPAGGAELVR